MCLSKVFHQGLHQGTPRSLGYTKDLSGPVQGWPDNASYEKARCRHRG